MTQIRIGLTSVLVTDQARALAFYTDVLGFEKKTDIPAGEYRFVTVVSPAGAEGVELLLEPNAHPAAKAFQEAIRADGIPAASFFVDDLDAEVARLEAAGVTITTQPLDAGGVRLALFDDTCGNLIQLAQV